MLGLFVKAVEGSRDAIHDLEDLCENRSPIGRILIRLSNEAGKMIEGGLVHVGD